MECDYPPQSHCSIREKKQEDNLELNAAIIAAAGLDDPKTNAEGKKEVKE